MGDTVAFQIHMNAKGQPAASAPMWKLVGKSFGGKPVELGAHMGRISRMLPDGSVFLECPELTAAHGTEVYAHKSVVQQCGLQLGEIIAFSVHVSRSGQPQVSAPCWKCCSPNWRLEKAMGQVEPQAFAEVEQPTAPAWATNLLKNAVQEPEPEMMVPAGVEEEEVAAIMTKLQAQEFDVQGHVEPPMSGDHYIGTVSSIANNHCRVTCPDYEKGVYVHAKVGSSLVVGETVAFKVHLNAKGQPAASAPIWKLMGKVFSGKPVQLGEHAGKVSKIVKDGSAFLESPQLAALHGAEVYAHASVVQKCGLSVGDVLAFSVHISQTGQPQVSAPCWKCVTDNWKVSGFIVGNGNAWQGKGGKSWESPKGKGSNSWESQDNWQWGASQWKGQGGDWWESPQAKRARVMGAEENTAWGATPFKGKGGNSWRPALGPGMEGYLA